MIFAVRDHRWRSATGATLILFIASASPTSAISAPTADVAKKCIRYSYIVYPYQRPGAVKASGNRQAYLNDCLARNGDVPEPVAVPRPGRP